ncbi:hypothetical protein LY76DRAFT_357035 [Colletotrichum caudatum]|nr:hypothetical protein LY76DRAFT_357035 [Colletotrichum caudatum]
MEIQVPEREGLQYGGGVRGVRGFIKNLPRAGEVKRPGCVCVCITYIYVCIYIYIYLCVCVCGMRWMGIRIHIINPTRRLPSANSATF